MSERRRRNEVYVGMKIEHKYRRSAPKEWGYDWFATVMEISPDENEIHMSVTGQHGQSHDENWNKEHTESGLLNLEYVEIPAN